MLFTKFIILCLLPICFCKSVQVTFKNVTIRGLSVFTEKFKRTITSGTMLKDFLPMNVIFDAIEMKDQHIPILYKDSLSDMDNLDELVIEYCEVEDIQPGAISGVHFLRKLSFKGNNIKNIERGIFNNLPISTVDLSLNQISKIHSEAFDDMPNLLNINLADNFIKQWNPEWFKNTPLLTRISMQNNSIEELPAHAFKNMKGEKKFGRLDLSINLVFSHNKIKQMDLDAFSDLKKINNLWLDYNALERFDENLLNGVKINDLRLNNNRIKCLEGNLEKVLAADTNHVDSNPFDCECLEKIIKWSKKNGNVELIFAEMQCSAERIKNKMTALKKRLKELKNQRKEVEEVEYI